MIKNKIGKFAITGILVGALTIGSVGVVAMQSGNAYENYKQAAFATMQTQNITTNSVFEIKQDGVSIASGDETSQVNGDNIYSDRNITMAGETLNIQNQISPTKSITKVGDVYTENTFEDYGSSHMRGNKQNSENSPSTTKLINMMTDLMVGDVKTHFTNSAENITLNLEGAQVPELINVAASAMLEKSASSRTENNSQSKGSMAMTDALDKVQIQQDVKVKSISMTAKLDAGFLTQNDMTVVLMGKDSSGASHEVELTFNTKLTNINSTTPKTIDTTGKTVVQENQD